MINLDAKDIGEFQRLWQVETGQEIPADKAREYAENLVSLLAITVAPRPP